MTTAVVGTRPAAVTRPATALPAVRLPRRRGRPRYRYSLTTIDVMFAAAAQTAEAERDRDRMDHRAELYVLGFGLLVLIMASVGTAFGLKQLVHIASSFLG